MLGEANLQPLVGTARPDAARTFYGETLGLKLVEEDQFALIFQAANASLRVSKAPTVIPAAYAVLSFQIKDATAAARALVAKGVTMERFGFLPQDSDGIWTAPGGAKVAWFRDPDGNLLSIAQMP